MALIYGSPLYRRGTLPEFAKESDSGPRNHGLPSKAYFTEPYLRRLSHRYWIFIHMDWSSLLVSDGLCVVCWHLGAKAIKPCGNLCSSDTHGRPATDVRQRALIIGSINSSPLNVHLSLINGLRRAGSRYGFA